MTQTDNRCVVKAFSLIWPLLSLVILITLPPSVIIFNGTNSFESTAKRVESFYVILKKKKFEGHLHISCSAGDWVSNANWVITGSTDISCGVLNSIRRKSTINENVPHLIIGGTCHVFFYGIEDLFQRIWGLAANFTCTMIQSDLSCVADWVLYFEMPSQDHCSRSFTYSTASVLLDNSKTVL